MMKKILYLCLFIVAISGAKNVRGQMVVDNTITVNDLVNDYLVGENVNVFNILINGVPGDSVYTNIGLFDASNSNIPIQNGIVMGPMDVNYVIDGDASFGSGNLPSYSDADLDSLAAPLNIPATEYAILEFDFIPQGEVVLFRYVFSSEEYPGFVCSQYNDAFGFFISGPGINGPYMNGAENIAIIPGTDLPVAINTVNDGNPATPGNEAGCPEGGLDNSEYFIVNYNMPSPATAMNGFTTVLEATSVVQCGEMYHLKMAISNVSDGALDSGVFLESGSFGAIPIVQIDIDTPTDSSLVGEGCQIDFVFNRLLNAEADTVELFVSGAAESGVDFEELPSHIIFEAGQSTYTLPIVGIYDEIEEGIEDLTLLMRFFTCGDTLEFSATAFITDSDPLYIDILGPSSICQSMGDSATMLADVSGGYGEILYYWTADSIGGEPTDPNDTLNTHPKDSPILYSYNWLTVIDECGLYEYSDKGYYTENNCPILAPNIFTPNNDGKNDFFILENIELFPNSQLLVYDRWGRLVYENNSYDNSWDGKNMSGNDVADGVYFWMLTLSEPEIEGSQLRGSVTITRQRQR